MLNRIIRHDYIIFFSLVIAEQTRRFGDYSNYLWLFIKLYFVFLALLCFVSDTSTKQASLNKSFFPIGIVFFYSIINGQFFNRFQTVLLIFLMIYFYWSFISKVNIVSHFKSLMNFSVFISLFGIFQQIYFLLSNRFILIFDKHEYFGGIIRVNSFFSEPSHLGLFLLPATYIVLRNFFINDYFLLSKKNSAIILIGFIMSFSTTAIAGLFIIIFFIQLEKGISISIRTISIYFMLIFGLYFIFYDLIIVKIAEGFDLNMYTTRAQTSSGRALFFGVYSILETVKNNLFLGYGFENYHLALKDSEFIQSFLLLRNYIDNGHSFGYGRIIVEFGLVGFSTLIILGIINYNKENNRRFSSIKIINIACLIFLVLALFKIGHFKYAPYWYMTSLFFASRKNFKKKTLLS